MQTHTSFVGVDAHIDPCSRHNRFYETLRQKRVYPTGGQGRPPLRVRSCSHRCTKICNVVPRGRGRTPPLRQIITCSLFTITYSLNSPLPCVTTKRGVSSKIRTLPLISRLRRQLPPEGKPWRAKSARGNFPAGAPVMRTALYPVCRRCTSHHNPAVSPAPACPGCRFRSQNPPWSRGRCR